MVSLKRKALLSDSGETEDEIHFVFYCSLHDDLKASLILFVEPGIGEVLCLQCNFIRKRLCSCLTNVSPLQPYFWSLRA